MARTATPPGKSAGPHYRVSAADPKRHRYAVELRIAHPAARQAVSLPVWIPGSYLIREFARNLDSLSATQGKTARAIRQLDKCSWEIDCDTRHALTLRYTVYAFDPSVRAAWLDGGRGFFNGTSLLLRVHGREALPHHLTVDAPADGGQWQLATAMQAIATDRRGFGTYAAATYDELVDHPVELGAFWSGRFTARGMAHRFVVTGAPASFDGARLLRDAQAICETEIDFWRGCPRDLTGDYVFLLNAGASGYGGIEHRASCALVCSRADLPRIDVPLAGKIDDSAYQALLGVISHEYFHAWNVKRLKPAEFARFDYARENPTDLLWFFEGFTSYYDDLLLRRAGLIDDAAYFRLLTKGVNQVLQAPGRHVQSVAQASFDAWTRFYRADENTPNSTISYYSKGAHVALCLDLTLRHEGHATLDDVMRALWQRCPDGLLREGDIAAALEACGERSFDAELAAWVHGTDDLPLEALLGTQGVEVARDVTPLAQALGLRVDEDRGITLRVVLDGSPAAEAGLSAGDEWIGIELKAHRGRHTETAAWRLHHLDDIPLLAGNASEITALVARAGRLLRLPLALPRPSTTWRLVRPNERTGTHAWPAA
ncbi:MAG: peptidase M61 [Burkholderiaceae bacterium]|nr:MAG: peptidase M61 [Burkholderiaceae bacterium]